MNINNVKTEKYTILLSAELILSLSLIPITFNLNFILRKILVQNLKLFQNYYLLSIWK